MSRILVVCSTFPQFKGDPRGEFILRHWERQACEGAQVRVLAPLTRWCRGHLASVCEVVRFRYAPRRFSSLSGNYGIPENLRERPWRALLIPTFLSALSVAVKRELELFAPDRVVAHMLLPCGWSVARHCSEARVPFELFGHGTDVDVLLRLPQWFRRRFGRRARCAEKVHLPSKEKLDRFRRAFPGVEPLRVETMVHCVPDPLPQPPSLLRHSGGILYLGRLTRQKGVDDLLEAAARMRPTPLVHIAGDGPERRRLERLARRLGVAARFYGFVSGQPKAALLHAADVLCVPSRELPSGLSEGAPLVIREAFSYGLPVVATTVGGIPELCAGSGVATLTPADRPDALAHALAGALAADRRPLRTA